jgi:hypothetical protein
MHLMIFAIHLNEMNKHFELMFMSAFETAAGKILEWKLSTVTKIDCLALFLEFEWSVVDKKSEIKGRWSFEDQPPPRDQN